MLITTSAASAAESLVPRGVINFHTVDNALQNPPGLDDPAVAGGEQIIWWGDLEKQEGVFDWSVLDADLAQWQAHGKRVDLRLSTAHIGPDFIPRWLYDHYSIRRIGRGLWSDFENGFGPYVLGPQAIRSSAPEHRIGGSWSIFADYRGSDRGEIVATAATTQLVSGATYSVQCDLQALSPAVCYLELTSRAGGPAATQSFSFSLDQGERRSPSFTVTLGAYSDYRLTWGLIGPGQVCLDHSNIIRLQPIPDVISTDLSLNTAPWQLLSGARLSAANDELTTQPGQSIVIENKTPGFRPLLVNDPAAFPLRLGETTRFTFVYRALTDCTLHFRIASELTTATVGERSLSLKAGRTARFATTSPEFLALPRARVQIGLIGPGRLAIAALTASVTSDRVPCFPDYFSPVFQRKWAEFVTRVADRYRGHPALGEVSVGGFGRWEEVMLDEDHHGLLDEQWIARGYSPERYLQVITDCMDLYRRAFGQHPLRICLAYGLRWTSNERWIYRRVAQAAVARGIGLKQNGLSELYDSWDEFTEASYLFDRYRHSPGISLTHETGGQIFRNTLNAHGHPLSCINRGLINGIDTLFLYGSDLRANHVRTYLPYAAQLLGDPFFTQAYCHLGDMTLHFDNMPAPTAYRNQWLGLRQVNAPGAEVSPSSRSESKCVITSPGNSIIQFDLDDRQQYSGMYDPIIAVDYWDEGRDCFEVRVLDALTQTWQMLGRVQKHDSKSWKTATFSGKNWCRSPRNSGRDVQNDLLIDDLGDGIEAIRSVELCFIPAREWRMCDLATNSATNRHQPLDSPIRFGIDPPAQQALPAMLRMQLWSGSLAPSGVRARVFSGSNESGLLLADKEYDYPADKDWLELPLHGVRSGPLFVELSRKSGDVGLYFGSDGLPAWQLCAYAPQSADAEPTMVNGAIRFDATRPFCGVSAQLPHPQTAVPLQLYRVLPEGAVTSPTRELIAEAQPMGEELHFAFEPRLPGTYELRAEGQTLNIPASAIKVLELQRRNPPRPPIAQPSGARVVDLLSTESARVVLKNLTLDRLTSGNACLKLTGMNPSLSVQLAVPLEADARHRLHWRFLNTTGCGIARLVWIRAGHETKPCSALIPLIPNDSVMREVVFPVGLEPDWNGKILALKLEPVTGGVSVGSLEIEHAWIDLDPAPR